MNCFVLAAAKFALRAGTALADLAAPARAAANDTVEAIVALGDAVDVAGMSYDLTNKPDGAF